MENRDKNVLQRDCRLKRTNKKGGNKMKIITVEYTGGNFKFKTNLTLYGEITNLAMRKAREKNIKQTYMGLMFVEGRLSVILT